VPHAGEGPPAAPEVSLESRLELGIADTLSAQFETRYPLHHTDSGDVCTNRKRYLTSAGRKDAAPRRLAEACSSI
jgi:hypothetical protein